MKGMIPVLLFLHLLSCKQETKPVTPAVSAAAGTQDTVIVKYQNPLNASYEVGFYSKSYTYYWVAGKDTLDIRIRATEHENDSTLQLSVFHKEPVRLAMVTKRLNECIRLIEDDFKLSKLNALYFRSPVYYAEMSKEVSTAYEKQFGQKNISHRKLNQFLLTSSLTEKLNGFLAPLEREVMQYGIEKFHLAEKSHYTLDYPDIDPADYPEYIIDGMGLSVRITSKKINFHGVNLGGNSGLKGRQ